MKQEREKWTINEAWLRRAGDLEEACGSAAVGGLAVELTELQGVRERNVLAREALARLARLSRRKLGLPVDELSRRASVPAAAIARLEHASAALPDAETISRLCGVLELPQRKVMALITTNPGQQLDEAMLLFTSSDEPLEKLSGKEERALQEFVAVLASAE